MSQAGRPRPRYIAFRIDAERPISRQAFSNALKGRARHEGLPEQGMPKLTRYEHPHGIVWADHRYATQVRDMLARITWVVEGTEKTTVQVTPLSTSGTLKTLTGRVGVLQERGTPEPSTRQPARGPRNGAGPGKERGARGGGGRHREPGGGQRERRSGDPERRGGPGGAPRTPQGRGPL